MVIKGKFFNSKIFNYFETKYKGYPITLFFDYVPNIKELKENPYNIFLAHEPNEFFGIQSWAINNHREFNAVLTWNKNLITQCPNAVEFYCGWVFDSNLPSPTEKIFEVSFLSGVKDLVEGHKLRHKVFSLEDQITIPKKWFKVLDDFDHDNNVRPGYTEYSKDLSHIPEEVNPEIYGKQFLFNSMFHIAIENVKYDNWYTEKIYQSFLNKTVPIYWGCPNLDEIGYDSRGVISFNSTDELLNILNNLTEEDYSSRLPYIEYNYEVAKQDTLKNQLSLFLDELIRLNNL